MRCVTVLLLISSWNIYAADIYFAGSSAGSNNGTSCANAYAISDATHGINNGAGNWTAGNILHLCGTITGSVGQNNLIAAQASGSSGNPITIKFETGANLTSAAWGSPVIYLTGSNFITVDGGTNGIIQNTANGTGLANQLGNSVAIQALAASSTIEIKNLTVANLYIHTKCEASSGCDGSIDQSSVAFVQFNGSNILIHDNTVHDLGYAILQDNSNSQSNIQVYNNNIYHMDHGFAPGANSSATIPSVFIHDNHFHDMDNWDTGTADTYHHDGIHAFSAPPGKIQDIYIYNNLFDGNAGDCCVTAWIFLEGVGGGTPWTDATGSAHIWNNLAITTSTVTNPTYMIGVGTGANHQVFNNTIIGQLPGSNVGLSFGSSTGRTITFTAENNVIQGISQPMETDSGVLSWTVDYNVYANANGGGSAIWSFNGYASGSTLAAWRTSCSCDAHSQAQLGSGLSNINSAGVISAGFIGASQGLNLTSTATGNLSTLSSSTSAGGAATPSARPSSAAWDVGAYQVSSSPSSPTVTTTSASSITTTTASTGGNVTSDGGASVTSRGTCYATSSTPTTPCTSDGTGTGSFTSSLSGLSSNTLYHIRAFATNSVGTSYGSDLTFTTSATVTAGAVCAGCNGIFH